MGSCALTPETTAEHHAVETTLDQEIVQDIQVRIGRSASVAGPG